MIRIRLALFWLLILDRHKFAIFRGMTVLVECILLTCGHGVRLRLLSEFRDFQSGQYVVA